MSRRFALFAAAVLCVAASSAGWGLRGVCAREAAPAERSVGAPELQTGFFRVASPLQTHAVGFVWVRTESSVLKESWLLFRPETSEGWLFPGADHTNVTLTFVRMSGVTATTLADFKTWAEGQYPSAMSVDADVDFAVHDHTVEVL
jgi:hypothetical protein